MADGTTTAAARGILLRGPDATAPTIAATRGVEGPREETSLLGFVNVVLRYRALISLLAIVGGLIFGLRELTRVHLFIAYASFTVRGARAPTPASELAAQLGLNVGADDNGQSADFFIDLVRSRGVVARVADSSYTISTAKGPVRRPLAALYGEDEGKSGPLSEAETVDRLRGSIEVSTWGQTGIIRLSVIAAQPSLAQQILANVIRELDAYNLARRKEKAAAERQFVEKLLSDARVELAQAETQLSTFKQLNRQYANSPALALENSRLTRQVTRRQEIVTAMSQSLEQAKIEEVRDIPAITLIDEPEPAFLSATHETIRKGLLGMAAGLMVGIMLAFILERAAETREARTPVYNEFTALKKETAIGVSRPFGMVVRLFNPPSRT